jgi:hypothetical protein
VFARCVPVAEIFVGCALILGFWVFGSATAALLLVLNYHIASGAFTRPNVVIDSSVAPLMGTLLGLAVASRRQASQLAPHPSGDDCS